jgi:hypothetical protein
MSQSLANIVVHLKDRGIVLVSPLQGEKDFSLDLYLGLRAGRFTPGCHMTGFQP